MAESVKVIVRCRPMNGREKGLKCKPCLYMDGNVGQCRIVNPSEKKAQPKMFTFDGAYYTESTTEVIYADIAYPLVEVSCCNHFNFKIIIMFKSLTDNN